MILTFLGIAIPSLLIVLAIRRWFEPVPWRVCGFLFALVLITVGRGVFSTEMPVALDEVVRGYPYRGIFGAVTSKNPDTNDTVKQMLPWMQVVREELRHRRVPLWNRYSFSGYPLLGNAQSAPFSPFFLLTLFVPLPKQLVAMAGVKLFAGLLFTYLLIRREGSPIAAVFGAVVYSLSIFNNVYLYYPLSAVTFLLPAVCYATLRVLDDRRAQCGAGNPACESHSAGEIACATLSRSFVLLAITVACTLVAGHPESTVHVAIGVLLLVIVEWIAPVHPLEWRRVAQTIGAAIAGLCLAAPAFFPVVQQILQSQRLAAIGGGERKAITYPITVLWLALNPDGFGNPALGNWHWYMHYIMAATSYVGLIPLTLLPLAPFASRRERVLLFIVIVTFLVAMNWTVIGHLVHLIPPFSFTANDRLRFVTIFFVAILSARMLDRMAEMPMPAVLAPPLIVLAFAVYVFAKQYGVTLSAISGVGIVALILFWSRRAAIVALVATAVELIVFNWPFNAMTPIRYYEPGLPIIEALHRMAPAEPFRIVGADWTFLPNASAQYGLEDIRGSDPMAWAPYTEFFRQIQAPGQSSDVGRVINVTDPAVRFLNVHFLLAEPNSDFPPPWRLVYRGKDGDLYRHENPLPRFFATDGQPTGMWLREINPQRFRLAIDAAGPLFIASSQPAAPGWIVKVNHRTVPIVRLYGAFIGFRVPQGKSQVSVEYHPFAFRIGVILFVITIAAMIAYPYMSHRGIARSATRGRSGFGAAASANHHGNSRDQIV